PLGVRGRGDQGPPHRGRIASRGPAPQADLGPRPVASGHHAAAADALQEAALREPKGIDAQVDRGAALLLAGRTREAIGVLRETLETDPTRADALNNLGVAYLAMGRPKSAAVNLERAAQRREA